MPYCRYCIPKLLLAADGAVAGSFPSKNGTVFGTFGPGHRRTFFPFLYGLPLHDHARSESTTAPHPLERPVQQWAFLETS